MPSTSSTTRNPRSIEATMIRATNLSIKTANMTMENHQTNEATQEKRYAHDLLRANSSLAALVDANERYDPPRCTEATRRNVLRIIQDWVRYDPHHSVPSSIFWLYGGAGAGKSALAQTLAEKSQTNKDLAASFFFFRADANRNDGNRLISTLAYQLVHTFPGLSPLVEEKILENPDLFKKSREVQMLELLVEPLMKLWLKETDNTQSNTPLNSHSRLVVIDGLDECRDPETQCDLLRIIANALPHIPYPIRFLITSRPESHLARTFRHDLEHVARYDLSDDSDADMDIRNFLNEEFAKIRRTHPLQLHLPSQWPPLSSINSIVERSSGHFIYASTAIRFIRSPQHRPDDRLQVILGLKQPYEKDQPFARLDSLYSLIFLEIDDPVQLEKIHRAFGIIHLRSLKSGLFAWPLWTSDRRAIEALLALRPGDLVLLFDRLLSLVSFEGDNIRIFHKSLFDYLLDSSRSGDFQLSLGLAHETAANYILRENHRDDWDSADFQNFAYHCQFARLDDTLSSHLRFLAGDPKITFTNSGTRWRMPSEEPCPLQPMFHFLQAFSRPDFDSSGQCYGKYVEKMTQFLRSAVPWSQRLKIMVSRLTCFQACAHVRRRIHASFRKFDSKLEAFGLKGVKLKDTNGRTLIPAVSTSVVQSVEREHKMLSSYIKERYRYPDIVVSFLESNTELIHSCHFVIGATAAASVTFVMLVTYTAHGLRLSCSEFEGLERPDIYRLVEEHLLSTQRETSNNHGVIIKSLKVGKMKRNPSRNPPWTIPRPLRKPKQRPARIVTQRQNGPNQKPSPQRRSIRKR